MFHGGHCNHLVKCERITGELTGAEKTTLVELPSLTEKARQNKIPTKKSRPARMVLSENFGAEPLIAKLA